jgi:hypothetical protein
MKNIIDIYEASILDVEGTIKDGDDAIAEFDKLKSTLMNKRNWGIKKRMGGNFKGRSGMWTDGIISIPNVIAMTGMFPKEYGNISIELYKDVNSNWQNYSGNITISNMYKEFDKKYFRLDPFYIDQRISAKTPEDVIKNLIPVVFKDFDTFVEFLKKHSY